MDGRLVRPAIKQINLVVHNCVGVRVYDHEVAVLLRLTKTIVLGANRLHHGKSAVSLARCALGIPRGDAVNRHELFELHELLLRYATRRFLVVIKSILQYFLYYVNTYMLFSLKDNTDLFFGAIP